jgi:hypothetical protein
MRARIDRQNARETRLEPAVDRVAALGQRLFAIAHADHAPEPQKRCLTLLRLGPKQHRVTCFTFRAT